MGNDLLYPLTKKYVTGVVSNTTKKGSSAVSMLVGMRIPNTVNLKKFSA